MATTGKPQSARTIQMIKEIQAVRMRVSRLRDEIQHDLRSELQVFKKQLDRTYRAKQAALERERAAKEQTKRRQEEEEPTNPYLVVRAAGTEDCEQPAADVEHSAQDDDASVCMSSETMGLQHDEVIPMEVQQQKESAPGPEEITCALQLSATTLEADFSFQQTRRVSHEEGNAPDEDAADGGTRQNTWTYYAHEHTGDLQLSESSAKGAPISKETKGEPHDEQKQGHDEESELEWVEPQRNRSRICTPENSLVGDSQHSKEESINSNQVVLGIEVAFHGTKRPIEEVMRELEEPVGYHTYLHCLDALSSSDSTLSDTTCGKRHRHSFSMPTKKWRRMHRDRRLQSVYVDY